MWDGKGIASEVLGLTSILTWMVVGIPQMAKNCKNIRGVEGVSCILILMWTLGDSANLVGAILTKQLPLQIYLAIYFVFADLVLFTQFLYYNLYWKRRFKGYIPINSSTHNSGVTPQVVLCVSGAMFLCLHKSVQIIQPVMSSAEVIHHPAGRSLMAHNLHYHTQIFHNLQDVVGYAVGVVSSIFYTFSRLGQMYKNYKRKSTDGLSVLMFILAVVGNLTYGLSILVRQIDASYVVRHLPWLIGSLGVILLDLSLLVQFKWYSRKDDQDRMLQQPVSADNSYGTDSEIYVPANCTKSTDKRN